MRKEIITAVETKGIDSCVSTYVFTVLDDDINLVKTIKEAAACYINTDIGYQEFQHNCQCFNWGDFYASVPNSFLLPFGIQKDEMDVEETTVDFDEQLVSENDLKFSDEKWEILKKELFMRGTEALDDFIGNEAPDDKDVVDNMLDQVADQMPDEELFSFYEKCCLPKRIAAERRIQKLVKAMKDAEEYVCSMQELEMVHFDNFEANGEMYNGWFACRNDGSSATILSEFSDQPLITDDDIDKLNIDIIKVFVDHGVEYCE